MLARRAPEGTFTKLVEARPLPLVAGFTLFAAAHGIRAVRLNRLLPERERIPPVRAAAISGASTFLLQVIPFRGGEVATYALFRRELVVSWARAGAVFALVKTLDTAATLLVGLAGAATLASRRGHGVLGTSGGVLVAAGAFGLLALPLLGRRLVLGLARRVPLRSRRRRLAREVSAGLSVATAAPRSYLVAYGCALAFWTVHIGGLVAVMRGLSLPVSPGTLAFATLGSIVAAAIPSPGGTFGPAESGFALALSLDGVPFVAGLGAAAIVHLVMTAAAGLVGLPVLLSTRVRGPA